MKLNNKHMLIYNKDMMSLMYAVKMVVLLNIIRYMSNGQVLNTCCLHSTIRTKYNALRNNYLRIFVINARRINIRREAARRRRRVPIVLACENIENVNWIEKSKAKYYDSIYNYYGLKDEDRSIIETVVGMFI